MPSRCSVLGCPNNSTVGHFLYSFPRDESLRRKWEITIRGPEWKSTKNSFICEAHFEEGQFQSHYTNARGKKKLKQNAVPSINCSPRYFEDNLRRKAESDRNAKKFRTELDVQQLQEKIKRLIMEKDALLKKIHVKTCNKQVQVGYVSNNIATQTYSRTCSKAVQAYAGEYQNGKVLSKTSVLPKTRGKQASKFNTFTQVALPRLVVVNMGRTSIQAEPNANIQKTMHDHNYLRDQSDHNKKTEVNVEMACKNIKVEPMDWAEEEIHEEYATNSEVKVEVNGEMFEQEDLECRNVDEHHESTFSKDTELYVVPDKLENLVKTEINEDIEYSSVNKDARILPDNVCISSDPSFEHRESTFSEDDETRALPDNLENLVKTEIIDDVKYQNVDEFQDSFKVSKNDCAQSIPENSPLSSHLETKLFYDKCGNERNVNGDSNSEEGPFSCAEHGKIFEKEKHFEQHLRCGECEKTFNTRYKLKIHVASSHSKEGLFLCDKCGKSFTTEHNLKQHLYAHSEEKLFPCTECGKSYTTEEDYKTHLSAVHSEEKRFCCDACDKTFKTHAGFKLHLACHSEDKPFSCSDCAKAFKFWSNLTSHVSNCHSKEKKFSCSVCRKLFKTRNKLKRHVAHCHSEERPLTCKVCGKAFKLQTYLNLHLNLHSKEKTFSCNVCGKTFNTKACLKIHLFCHSEERPLSCNECGKIFKSEQHLKQHLSVPHSEERLFPCDECGKAYKKEKDYKHHLLIHSETL